MVFCRACIGVYVVGGCGGGYMVLAVCGGDKCWCYGSIAYVGIDVVLIWLLVVAVVVAAPAVASL